MFRSFGWVHVALAGLCCCFMTHAFMETRLTPWRTTFHRQQQQQQSPLFLAGFGSPSSSSSGSSSSSSSKEKKLKPKQQWDRYTALRQETKIRVAVRVANTEGEETEEASSEATAAKGGIGDWLEVGRVRSKDNAMTAGAVVQQRGLIVEHARRLFPLQISPKDRIEWAYWSDDKEDWIVVDPKQPLSDLPDQWDKQIGFEGRPDPASGYYCFYKEGRLVTDDEVEAPSKRKFK